MRSYFGQKTTLLGIFGTAYTGLATVGYTIYNGDGTTFQARTTAGVSEVVTGTGIYKVELGTGVFAAAFDGYVVWDTGGTTPQYAGEDMQIVAAPPAGSDYTSARAAFLDAAVSSRLATSGYTAPDNADVVTILADVVTLIGDANTLLARIPSDIWDEAAAGHTTNGTFGKLMAFLDAAVSSRLPTSGYTAPDNADIATVLTDLLAVKAKTDLLGMGIATLVSPVAVSGRLDLIAGADYLAADNLAIVWTGTWPSLASVELVIGDVLTVNGTVTAGPPASVSFDLTAAQTASLPSSTSFIVWGTRADGSKVPIARGLCTAT